MNPVVVAVVMVVMLGVGVFIGVSGLATQLAVDLDLSRGSAAEAACAPDRTTAVVGQTVHFLATGLDTTASYHWSANEGRFGRLENGQFWVIYDEAGTKTVSVFFPGRGARWQQASCSVTVR